MIILDQFTLTTVPIEQYFNETYLGQGTGFMWQIGKQYYLITNWHVLAAHDFFTKKPLRSGLGRLNKLRTLFNTQAGTFEKKQIDIIIRDEGDKPLCPDMG